MEYGSNGLWGAHAPEVRGKRPTSNAQRPTLNSESFREQALNVQHRTSNVDSRHLAGSRHHWSVGVMEYGSAHAPEVRGQRSDVREEETQPHTGPSHIRDGRRETTARSLQFCVANTA
jgi:hypothetical protein